MTDSRTLHQRALRVRGDAAAGALRPVDWAATVAPVLAWPLDDAGSAVVERRFWRTRRRGPLQQAIIAGYRDPLRLASAQDAARQLEELLRPLRSAPPLPLATAAQRAALAAPVVGYMAELGRLDGALPEGAVALGPAFRLVLEGLQTLDGAVGLSLLVLPPEPGDQDDDAGAPVAAVLTPGPEARPLPTLRRARFCLRMFAARPIPAVLRARAEAMCLAGAPAQHAWTVACTPDAAAAARDAIAAQRPLDADAVVPCRASLATLTLGLPEPVDAAGRLALGRPVDGPLPSDGPVLGRAPRRDGRLLPWRLSWEQRRLHTFLAGASGCGKTTALLRLALADVEADHCVVLVDFHGDVADQLAVVVPAGRLVHVDPRRADTAPLQLLDPDPARAAAHLLSAVSEVWPQDFAGPMYHRAASLTCRALAATEALDRPWTLIDVDRFVTDSAFRRRVISRIDDRRLVAEVQRSHEVWDKPSRDDSSTVDWVASKLTPLTGGPGAALFAALPAAPLEEQIAAGAIIVVALPIGTLGTATASLAGRMFLPRLTAAIAAQGERPEDDRRPVSVIIDEAHLTAGQALGGLFAQARKFHASITVACQSPSQLEPHLEDVLTNAQTHLFGRLSAREALRVGARLGEEGVHLLPRLPRHHLVAALENSDPDLAPLVLTPVPPAALPAPPPRPPAPARLARDPDDQPSRAPASFADQLDERFPAERR